MFKSSNRVVSIKLSNGKILHNIFLDNETGEIIFQETNKPKDDYIEAKDLNIHEDSIVGIKEERGILFSLHLSRWKLRNLQS